MLLITACSSSEEEIIDRPIDSGETNPDVASPDQDTEQEQNFIWKNWYLSVPIDRGNGKATSIYYEAIENNTLTDDQLAYFYKNNDGSYTLYTKFTGYTTSGEYALDQKKYCRTELREYWRGNQTTSDNWSMTTGTHIMESTLKVNFCEGNKQTYVAQIHGIKNEALGLQNSPATVKVQWYDGDIVIEYYKKPESGEWTSQGDGKITIGKVDNEKFTIFLKIENGKLLYKLICGAKNIETAYVTVYDYVGNGYSYENYFKTGNYFKWDDDYTQSAEVILYSVKTTHD
ncbi:hypothetical protein GCM10022258_20650 [Aquimarina gracilis]